MNVSVKSVLKVQDLQKHYGAIEVTNHVNLSVHNREIHGLIGPNGAGKTTLLGQIAGEIRPDAGRIMLLGEDVTQWSVARRARLGMARTYQINAVIPDFTALQNVLLAVQARSGHNFRFFAPVLDDARLVDQAKGFLDRVGLQAHMDRPVAQLAYGQQRLVEIATALACEPEVLLLDEPMAGLGPAETERMIALFSELRADCAMLLVEHDMSAVFALADRVSVLVYGQIILTGTPEEVRQDVRVREAYLGEEEST